MARRNRTAGAPRTRTNTVVGFRLEPEALAKLDALAVVHKLKRASMAEKIVRDAMDNGVKLPSIAEQKALRQAVMEFKKEAGAALWEVVQKWAERRHGAGAGGE